MNKNELIDTLNQSRADLLAAIEGLDDEAMLEPALANGWSLKDLLAHLTAWEAQLVTLLYQVAHGQTPTTIHFRQASTEETNARWEAENRARPLEQVLSDFRAIHAQTIRRLEPFSEADLFEPGRYAWARDYALYEWVASDSYGHERDHLEEVRAWRAGKKG